MNVAQDGFYSIVTGYVLQRKWARISARLSQSIIRMKTDSSADPAPRLALRMAPSRLSLVEQMRISLRTSRC